LRKDPRIALLWMDWSAVQSLRPVRDGIVDAVLLRSHFEPPSSFQPFVAYRIGTMYPLYGNEEQKLKYVPNWLQGENGFGAYYMKPGRFRHASLEKKLKQFYLKMKRIRLQDKKMWISNAGFVFGIYTSW
jgi:alkylation response protein AidB-like acyl-CoA dehydrogenase